MVLKKFTKFIKEYRVIAISVSFIIGIAALNFVQSIVNDLILPIIRPLISSNAEVWEDIIIQVGSANLRIGSFLSATLSLLIIVILVYVVVALILHWKPKKQS